MAPENTNKPRSCPEPGRMYLGFERKSSVQQPPLHHSPSANTPRPKSLLSLQLAPKVQHDLLADDESECSDFDDDGNDSVDSLDPSQCASLSSFEVRHESNVGTVSTGMDRRIPLEGTTGLAIFFRSPPSTHELRADVRRFNGSC